MKNLSQYPIFIIGTSRSGTELMSQILSKHSEVKIAMETHYFEDLRQQIGTGKKTLDIEETKRCQDYFLALTHKIYGEGGNPDRGWMKRDELETLAKTIGDGADSYFEAFCRIYAAQDDKKRWGEKTPRHVFRINEILECYPNAKIIYMLRHPAGVAASYRNFWKLEKHSEIQRNRLKNSYNPIINSMLWKAALKAAINAIEQFGRERVYIQKFEDLIENPESTIKAISNWTDLNYEPTTVKDIAVINSLYKDTDRNSGFLTQAADRWKKQLDTGEIAVIQSSCGKLLREVGYQTETITFKDSAVVAFSWLALPLNFSKALLANRDRMGNIFVYIWKRLRLATN